MMTSALEDKLYSSIMQAAIPTPVREYNFYPSRRWRFDFAWPDLHLAVEVEGGVYSKGRHTRGAGFEMDCEKYNQAVISGYRVLRYTASMIDNGTAIREIEYAVRQG